MLKLMIATWAVILTAITVFPLVTNLKAEFRGGKTFITFKEDGDTIGKTYNIYRSANAITSVSGMPVLVNIPSNSSWDARYNRRFVIVDKGQRLDSITGLFVYTPKETAAVYYAVTTVASGVENTQVTAGSNSMASAVPEACWPWPKGVRVQDSTDVWGNPSYLYFFWMDYFDWPKKYWSYGDYFRVNFSKGLIGRRKMPLSIYLHGAGAHVGDPYTLPSLYAPDTNAAFIILNDPCVPSPSYCQDFWFGRSNHFQEHGPQPGDTIVGYTEMRIIQYMQFIKTDTALFNIDTNRIYISGGRMGGGGTYIVSLHHPEYFAAAKPYIAWISFDGSASLTAEGLFSAEWGARSAPLPARGGVSIYNWMDAGWLAEQNPGADYPPILDYCNSNDATCPIVNHRHVYIKMQQTRHVIFGQWGTAGHGVGVPNNVVPGDVYRFVRNEMTPAFSNSTADGNWGKADSSVVDSVGVINGNIDWSSSRHRLGLPSDSLIDSPDSLCLTLKALQPGTAVDITPRRLQRFSVFASQKYRWKNLNIASSTVVDSGEVTADANAKITILQLDIATTGTRLVVTPSNPLAVESLRQRILGAKLSAMPNPFNASVRLKFEGDRVTRIAVYDLGGRLMEDMTGKIRNNTVSWNAEGRASGVYVIKLYTKDYTLQKRIVMMK